MTKIILTFGIVIGLILQWATTNVCRYNFTIDKKTLQTSFEVEIFSDPDSWLYDAFIARGTFAKSTEPNEEAI